MFKCKKCKKQSMLNEVQFKLYKYADKQIISEQKVCCSCYKKVGALKEIGEDKNNEKSKN